MPLSAEHDEALLRWLLGTPFPAPPAALWMSLHRQPVPAAANEVKGWGGGDRIPVGPADFAAIQNATDTGKLMRNQRALLFGIHGTNQRLESFALWDASASGNLVAWGVLVTPLDLAAGDPPVFMTGQLVVTAR